MEEAPGGVEGLNIPQEQLSRLEARLTGPLRSFGTISDPPAQPSFFSQSQASGTALNVDEEASTDETSKGPKKRRYFTAAEDDAILESYQRHGPDWEQVAQHTGLSKRTANQVKTRFKRLGKKVGPASIGASTHGVGMSSPIPAKSPPAPSFTNGGRSSIGASSPKEGSGEPPAKRPRYDTAENRMVMYDQAEDSEKLRQEAARERQQLIAQHQQEKVELIRQHEETLERMRSTVKDILLEKARQQSIAARDALREKIKRLGHVSLSRRGHEYVEVWEDGEAFVEHARLINQNAAERERIEKARKRLQQRPKSRSSERGDDGRRGGEEDADGFRRPTATPIDEAVLHDEIFKLRLAQLKKEETERREELVRLEAEKNLHIREIKRIRDEDASRFNSHPVLNKRYLLFDLLGKGGFSEVYKGFDLVDMRTVACKIHQLNAFWSDEKKANYTKHAVREYTIHRSLDHAGVVRLYDVFEIDANSFCTVLEHCGGGDLDEYLKLKKVIPEREAKLILVQIMEGLRYFSEQKNRIIHYDLKPGNILFTDSRTVKITDFGLSKVMADNPGENSDNMELTSQGAGTYWYLPPECFVVDKAPPRISSKVDVWSVGVIFYQMLYGQRPFGHNMSQQKILQEKTIINATSVCFPPQNKTGKVVSKEAQDFIRRCLIHRQEDRPDVLQLCQDPYLKLSKRQQSTQK